MIETMNDLRSFTVPAHIVFGFTVLVLFWVQIFSRKGSRFHVAAGKFYYWFGLIVVALAGYGVFTVIARAFTSDDKPAMSDPYLAAVLFLGYLAVITFSVLEKGRSAIRFRGPSPGVRSLFAWTRAALALSASLLLIAYAALHQPANAILLFALSPLGIFIAIETASFQLNGNNKPDRWVVEHLDGMIGSGIAFHTAFFVFGAGNLFEPLLADTPYQLVPWVLPTLIGLPATMIWKRRVLKAAAL